MKKISLEKTIKSFIICVVSLMLCIGLFPTTTYNQELDSENYSANTTQNIGNNQKINVESQEKETTTVIESNVTKKEETSQSIDTTKSIEEETKEVVNDEPQNNNNEGDKNENKKEERTSIKTIICSDIRIPSNYSVKELEKGLLYNLKPLAKYFIKAEEKYGVNAIILSSIAAEESGWGRYCHKPFNIFGFYTSENFESYEECINYVAKFLSEKYLTEGASCFNGYSLNDVNECYNGRESWYNNISNIAIQIENRIS